jgi:hypothetical protein
MSVYGIAWITLNSAGTEVEEARVHKLSKNGVDSGTAMARHEIANLIKGGDKVYVIVPNDSGSYKETDEVRVRPGQDGYLESFGADGAATNALVSLP